MKDKIRVQTKFISKNPLIQAVNKRFLSSICELAREAKVEKILDCGCGEGIIVNYLSEKLFQIKFEGFDIDQPSLDLAKRINPKARFKKGSIYQIPYEAESFPLVLCTEVLEHLDSPERALAEVRRVTAKQAIISVPFEPLFRISNMLRLKYLKRLGNTPSHVNNWTSFGFKVLLRKYFIIEKEFYPLPWMIFLVSKK